MKLEHSLHKGKVAGEEGEKLLWGQIFFKGLNVILMLEFIL